MDLLPDISFVVLDGSWKKSRKILYLNPWLNKLPKIKLPFQQSRYFLRKQKEEGFSTLEAVCAVLSKIEKNSEKYEALLTCLDKMMEMQSSFIQKEVFEEHFAERLVKTSSDKYDNKVESPCGHNNPDDNPQHPKTG